MFQISPTSDTPMLYGEKNKNSVFTFANKNLEDFIGAETSIIGKKDEEINSSLKDMSEYFYRQDRLVESEEITSRVLDINYYSVGLCVILTVKQPKIINGKLYGTRMCNWQLNNPDLIRLSIKFSSFLSNLGMVDRMGQCSRVISKTLFNLTENQFLVLFLLAFRKSIKQIASFLLVSPRTVEDILSRIKTKLNFIGSKKELFEYLNYQGLVHDYIPEKIIQFSSSAIKFI